MTPELIDSYISLVPYWAFSIGIAGSFYKGTVWIGNHFREDFRNQLSEWLKGSRDTTWIENFEVLFDTLFGKKHISFKRIVRSIIASIGAAGILYFLFAHILGVLEKRTFDDLSALQGLIAIITINFLADYLSLVETRLLLGVYRKVRGVFIQLFLLIADFIFTGLIALLLIAASAKLLQGRTPRPIDVLALFSFYSIFFYSSFFTSVWVWLYCISTWFVRIFTKIGLGKLFDIEKEPVKQVAFVGSALCLVSAFIIGPFIQDRNDKGNAFDRMLCSWDLESCFAAARASYKHGDMGPIRLFLEQACEDESHSGNCAERLDRYFGNVDLPKELWEAACTGGYVRGCRAYAWEFWRGPLEFRDVERAFVMFKQACEKGDLGSCNNMGVIYEEKNTRSGNLKAVSLYQKACNGGLPEGCRELANMYKDGNEVEKNPTKALLLYKKACNAETAVGCTNMGLMYEYGEGVQADLKKAIELYERACERNEAAGCNNLGTLYENGKGVPKNEAYAASLYRSACASSDGVGCRNIGELYETGEGVEMDIFQAEYFFQKACELGDNISCPLPE